MPSRTCKTSCSVWLRNPIPPPTTFAPGFPTAGRRRREPILERCLAYNPGPHRKTAAAPSVSSPDGYAQTAATLFSITSSCHRHGVDVFAYLQDMLQRIASDPTQPPDQLRTWLPDRWTPPV